MKCPAVEYVIQNTDIAKGVDEEFRTVYPIQSFTSKRYGKERYMQTINEAFVQEKVSHETLTHGLKYMSDKVGLTTMPKCLVESILLLIMTRWIGS
jgi:predicted nucleotide-binding protein (sugar kinase/HSP70/actin superfamily)